MNCCSKCGREFVYNGIKGEGCSSCHIWNVHRGEPMSVEFFKASDFKDVHSYEKYQREAAEVANAKLFDRMHEFKIEGVNVYQINALKDYYIINTGKRPEDIAPDKPDTAESLLREYLASHDKEVGDWHYVGPWIDRARKLLEKERSE